MHRAVSRRPPAPGRRPAPPRPVPSSWLGRLWPPIAVLLLGSLAAGPAPAREGALESTPRGSGPPPARPDSVYALTGGRWFDGKRFVETSLYVAGDTFAARPPDQVDRTLDLSGRWIVPPFGDAHTHNLDGLRGPTGAERMEPRYLAEGTFYVQVLANTRSGAERVRERFERRGTLDVRYAHGPLTSTLGHPFGVYEPLALGHYTADQVQAHLREICRSRTREGDAYWFVDGREELRRAWPEILEGRPDLVKVVLIRSESHARDEDPPCERMGHRGLDPGLVPDVVRLADEADLPVWAHVESAHDVEVAVRAGVDGLAHVPGYQLEAGEEPGPFALTEAQALRAGRGETAVTPTAARIGRLSRGDPSRFSARRARRLMRRNVELLARAGAGIVVGSDWVGETARFEVEALRELGLWTDSEVLRMWAVDTPRAIFPGRRLGRLEPGYEASFLALACDPRRAFACVGRIDLAMKQGRMIPRAGGDE